MTCKSTTDSRRCDLDDDLLATLYNHKYEMRLSAESAGILLKEGLIEEADLIAYSA